MCRKPTMLYVWESSDMKQKLFEKCYKMLQTEFYILISYYLTFEIMKIHFGSCYMVTGKLFTKDNFDSNKQTMQKIVGE
jgi:hypothetical protein